MGSVFWLALGLAALGFLAYRAGRIWVDAGRLGVDRVRRLGWALAGTVAPSRYWWRGRVGMLSTEGQADLLARETDMLGVSRADSLRCPLCGAEVPRAWALTSDGSPTVAPGPVECSSCDFRLDACRHCTHFLLGESGAQGPFGYGGGDITFGRCGHYKVPQPVERVCSPEVARRMKAQGWQQIRAPLPVVDSFVPPDFCTAFAPDRKRLRAGEVRWPDARRVALLKLLAPSPPFEPTPSEEFPSGDERWLL